MKSTPIVDCGDGDSLQARCRTASNAIRLLAGVYALHCVAIFAVVMLPERRTAVNYMAGIGIAIVVLCLLGWASACVRRGGRVLGAVVLAAVCTAGGALGSVFAATSIMEEHSWFVVLEIVVFACGVNTIVFLFRAHSTRIKGMSFER